MNLTFALSSCLSPRSTAFASCATVAERMHGDGSFLRTTFTSSRMPLNSLGFKKQEDFVQRNQDTIFPHRLLEQAPGPQHYKQGLLVALWANCSYWRLRPPPRDVEFVIQAWATHSCRAPGSVKIEHAEISRLIQCREVPELLRADYKVADRLVANLVSSSSLQTVHH